MERDDDSKKRHPAPGLNNEPRKAATPAAFHLLLPG